MKSLVRFRDLKEAGIVANWPQLKRLVQNHSFPPGRMLSDNVRVWTDAELDEWIESRPVAGRNSKFINKAKEPAPVEAR